jgi:hypothetical protein
MTAGSSGRRTVGHMASTPRRSREGITSGQISLDGFALPEPPAPAGDEDSQAAFAAHARTLEADYANRDADPWVDSQYAWIRNLAPARRGKVGGQLVDRWLRAAGVDVAPRLNNEHDRVISGHKTEVKMSTLWAGTGEYTFQQLRDQDYQLLILLGISPDRAHAWVLPKHAVLAEIGQTTTGAEPRWLTFPAASAPAWLTPYGGPLPAALDSLLTLTSTRP